MVNERIERQQTGAGEVVEVCVDLSDVQLLAAAHAVAAVTSDRYAGAALDADAVLGLRAIVALHDRLLESAQDGYAGGTLELTIDGLGLLADALHEWLARRQELGFMRAQEARDAPLVDAMIDDLTALHARALRSALGAPASYALDGATARSPA